MITQKRPYRFFMPGRLCLFGEHSDWAGEKRKDDPSIVPGYCLIAGTDQGLHAAAEPLKDTFAMESALPDGSKTDRIEIPMNTDALLEEARSGSFFAYAAAAAAVVMQRHTIGGMALSIETMDLPLKKGLSSSAAVCTLTAEAFSTLYGLGLDARNIMDIAYRGEILTGSECGRMDQACVLGNAASLLTFDGHDMSIETIRPACSLHLLIVDLDREKDTPRILRNLNHAYMHVHHPLHPAIRAALGDDNRHIVTAAFEAIRSGDAKETGRLMAAAQDIFDRKVAPCSPRELRAPALHMLLNHPAVLELSLGGKGVGSQGDGCAQFICSDTESRLLLAERIMKRFGLSSFPLTIPAMAEQD